MKVTYLEMFHWKPTPLEPPLPEVRVQPESALSVSDYRDLYNGVGRDYGWNDRNRMDDSLLQAILSDPGVEVHRLLVAERSAGYSELDRRQADEVQIAYFGLMADFIGKGLGKYFLDWTVARAWSYGPRRVWVHTCTHDHPAALPNYLRAGFRIYREEEV
jgi:GNAT superfamily N-acetyltransferase